MIPPKLSPGDEIRVIAPSTTFRIVSHDVREIALNTLGKLGLRVTFGKHCDERDLFDSSPIASRIADLHEAFTDPNVRGILTAIGGYNCNQLLRYLGYDLIRVNPKVFCGYSDITALSNAIYAKTGQITYSGPHFSTFGMVNGLEYTLEHFRKCLMKAEPFDVMPAEEWSDDRWYIDQQDRQFIRNNGLFVINEGQSEGILLGGNLCTFNLLQGTEFMPSLAGSILLLEDDEETYPSLFDRDLQSLIHQPGFEEVNGLMIGRFQKKSEMTREMLVEIVRSKPELMKVPVVANADFGHTTPQFTFPVGGRGRLDAVGGKVRIEVVEH